MASTQIFQLLLFLLFLKLSLNTPACRERTHQYLKINNNKHWLKLLSEWPCLEKKSKHTKW